MQRVQCGWNGNFCFQGRLMGRAQAKVSKTVVPVGLNLKPWVKWLSEKGCSRTSGSPGQGDPGKSLFLAQPSRPQRPLGSPPGSNAQSCGNERFGWKLTSSLSPSGSRIKKMLNIKWVPNSHQWVMIIDFTLKTVLTLLLSHSEALDFS